MRVKSQADLHLCHLHHLNCNFPLHKDSGYNLKKSEYNPWSLCYLILHRNHGPNSV